MQPKKLQERKRRKSHKLLREVESTLVTYHTLSLTKPLQTLFTASEKSRSNSFRETREEDLRDSVSLFSNSHKILTRPSKSSTVLSLTEERYSQERTKVIPPRTLTKRKMMEMPEVKEHQ